MSAALAIGIEPGESPAQRVARWTASYRPNPGLPRRIHRAGRAAPRGLARLLERLGGA